MGENKTPAICFFLCELLEEMSKNVHSTDTSACNHNVAVTLCSFWWKASDGGLYVTTTKAAVLSVTDRRRLTR